MARRDYVVEGGMLECTLGTAPGEILVTSQQKVKIKKKLKATNNDKTLKPPFFGSCTCSSPNPPCSPIFEDWQMTSKKSKMGDKRFVMMDSKIQCGKGGLVTVKDTGQNLVGTGKEELELDEKYPELKGEIIFANGYLSSSIGGALNAVLDLNPDEPNPDLQRGHNTNEVDMIDGEDILLDSELEEINAKTSIENKKEAEGAAIKYKSLKFVPYSYPYPLSMSPGIPTMSGIPAMIPVLEDNYLNIPTDIKSSPKFTGQEKKNVFWGYWNQLGNNRKGSETYAKYFNAENNEHFLNGSHGLGSNGPHRLDHGIAQGYHWAKYQWGIIPKQEVDDSKEKVPYIESYSPAYKPITIVMHSQGNAPGAGFALGAMKYANELGWDKMALNLIYLGVHQPKNLWEEEYENFVKVKTNHYQADSDFWDSLAAWERAALVSGGKPAKIALGLSQYLKNKPEDQNILKYLNGISELFGSEHHKLRNKRGIYEHLKAITDFNALKDRSVQFTFANDRADIVCRDGDIPKIDCACNPKIDSSLFSVEFFGNGLSDKNMNEYLNNQGKEILSMPSGGEVVIPSHAAVPRLKAEENENDPSIIEIKEWADYRSLALDWGEAMGEYINAKKAYEKVAGRKFSLKDLFFTAPYLYDKAEENVKLAVMNNRYRKLIRQYGRIQIADLYAHFAPVSFIHNEKILKHPDFENDGLGGTVWERIKKVGQDKFYRVEYGTGEGQGEMTSEQKRIIQKDYVKGEGISKMVDTGIANSAYIKDVIDTFSNDRAASDELYKEPVRSDAEQQVVDELLKQFGDTSAQRELDKLKSLERVLRENQIKSIHTKVVTKKLLK
ncbi:DUF4280 domain-containing protein [Zobellia roscoffensis]|uniref:DUF4280 domain-containing protein n=1 Tax=Zobellia roscoffensis TaxID=2779508 RepID=UPI00188C2E07|nr:DUF4280 domain-containing protein [Zobellia roscoffensis]